MRVNTERLIEAVKAVYYAAYWMPDRPVPDADLIWQELRDAAGLEPGHAPTPRPLGGGWINGSGW